MVVVDVERVSDSVRPRRPMKGLVGERDLLRLHAEKKGREAWTPIGTLNNTTSIDGISGL